MRCIDKSVEAVVAVFMALLLVLVCCAIIFRYLLGSPLTWSEELGRFCLVWISFLGAYLAHRRAQHVAVTFIQEKLPVICQRFLSLVLVFTLLGFLGVLTWFGTVYSLTFMSFTTPLLHIPLGLTYAVMPLSMALIFISVLLDFIQKPPCPIK